MARGPGRGGSRFSRPQGKPVQVAEAERTTQQQYQELERQQQTGMYTNREEENQFRASAYDTVTGDAGLQQHLAKVYGTLAGTVGVAALGAVGAMAVGLPPGGILGPAIGQLGITLYLFMGTSPQTHSPTFRHSLLGAAGLMSGMTLAPLLGFATALDPMIVPSALIATTGMFGVMSAGALMMPQGRMLSLGGPLLGGTLAIIGVGFAGMFCPVTSPWYPVLHSVNLYGGLGIFSLYIAYDTQLMIEQYKMGDRDTVQVLPRDSAPCVACTLWLPSSILECAGDLMLVALQAALSMFINLKIVFQKFLLIFIGRSD